VEEISAKYYVNKL